MKNIIVFEIDNTLLRKDIGEDLPANILFKEHSNNKTILITYEVHDNDEDLLLLFLNQPISDLISLQVFGLNSIAKGRLINNFEEYNPEISLIIIGSGEDSKMIKIGRKNVK